MLAKRITEPLSALGRQAAAEFQAGSVPSFALDSFPAGVDSSRALDTNQKQIMKYNFYV